MVKCVRVHWLSIIEFNKLRGTRTQLRMVSTYLDTVFGCWDPRRLPFRDQSEDRISVGISVRIIVRPVSYVEQDWTQKHGRYISCTCIACTTLSLYSLKAFTTVEVTEECSSLHLYFVLKCFCCWIYCMSGSFKVAQVWLSIGYGIYKFSTFPLNIYEKSAAVLNTECCIGWRQNVCMCYWIGWWCWLLLSRSTSLAKKKKMVERASYTLYIYSAPAHRCWATSYTLFFNFVQLGISIFLSLYMVFTVQCSHIQSKWILLLVQHHVLHLQPHTTESRQTVRVRMLVLCKNIKEFFIYQNK